MHKSFGIPLYIIKYNIVTFLGRHFVQFFFLRFLEAFVENSASFWDNYKCRLSHLQLIKLFFWLLNLQRNSLMFSAKI